MRIINISVFRDSQFSSKLFERKDLGKSLILFHLKNQTGKTTLYSIVRNVLSGKKMDSQKINTNVFGSASVTFTHGEDLIELKNNTNNFFWSINGESQSDSFQEYLIRNIFKKGEDYKIFYGGEKTSLSSLLRFCFFSGENFTSQYGRIADIFFQIFDGKGRYILFLFCLGAILNDGCSWNEIFTATNKDEKLRKEKKDLEKELSDSERAKEITKIKNESIFAVDLNSNLYKKQQHNNITIDNLHEILKKIDILLEKSKGMELDNKFIEFLEGEKEYIISGIKNLKDENDDIETKLSTFSGDKKDLLTYDEKIEKIEKIKSSLEEIATSLENAIQNEDEIRNKYISIVNKLQSLNNRLVFKIDKDELKVSMDDSSEGLLKGCKFLSNLALQIYAIENVGKEGIALFPFGFYDGVFGGSDEDVILECLNSLLNIEPEVLKELQVFCFINKYSSENSISMIDKFADDNSDFVDKISMKPGKKYLIGNI